MTANPLAYDAEVPNTGDYVRAPKQERSRRSFDKAVDAAISLLVERGSDAFTLVEVAERAGVSTGSIYTRVDSKDDLLRFAHAREMARMGQETEETFGAEPPPASRSLARSPGSSPNSPCFCGTTRRSWTPS